MSDDAIEQINEYEEKYYTEKKDNDNTKNELEILKGEFKELKDKYEDLEDGKVQLEKIVATAVQKSVSQLKIIKKLENELKSKIQLSSESESESDEDHFTEPHDDWNYADYEINYRKLLFYFNEQKEEYKGAKEEIKGLREQIGESKKKTLELRKAINLLSDF